MEKIYTYSSNEKQKKQSFFKKFFNDNGSMALFVVLAVVGIVGLTIFGFNQISFAAETTSTFPTTFTSQIGSSENRLIGEYDTPTGGASVMSFNGFYAGSPSDNNPVYCVEFKKDYVAGNTYSQSGIVNDYGLVYLLSKTYPNVKFTNSSGDELAKEAQIWLTQAAVWTYLNKISAEYSDDFDSDNVSKVYKLYGEDAAGSERIVVDNGRVPLFDSLGINQLITNAISINTAMNSILDIKLNSKNVSITNDNKYYQTDLISIISKISDIPILGNDSFTGYSVNLNSAPEGTLLVDEEGRVYDNISSMSPTSKFFLRVPVDKVTDENKDLKVSIKGNFKIPYRANYYSSGNLQRVVSFENVQNTHIIERPLEIQLDYVADVPDTGMGLAQTIYFIGLIILLSGVGIVYANAKPSESK